jgi:hypothetical protein
MTIATPASAGPDMSVLEFVVLLSNTVLVLEDQLGADVLVGDTVSDFHVWIGDILGSGFASLEQMQSCVGKNRFGCAKNISVPDLLIYVTALLERPLISRRYYTWQGAIPGCVTTITTCDECAQCAHVVSGILHNGARIQGRQASSKS